MNNAIQESRTNERKLGLFEIEPCFFWQGQHDVDDVGGNIQFI